MSYSAIPVDIEESETAMFVQACLTRLRAEAGLDEAPAVRPLGALLREETPTHGVVAPTERTASVASPALGTSMPPLRIPPAAPSPFSRRNALTVLTARKSSLPRRETASRAGTSSSLVVRLRWPVLVCSFVAGIFGGVALMKSPIGKGPLAQRVVVQARVAKNQAYGVYVTARAVKSRLLYR